MTPRRADSKPLPRSPAARPARCARGAAPAPRVAAASAARRRAGCPGPSAARKRAGRLFLFVVLVCAWTLAATACDAAGDTAAASSDAPAREVVSFARGDAASSQAPEGDVREAEPGRAAASPPPTAGEGWAHYGGDPGGQRYSARDEITPDNVSRLEVAWVHESGDVSDGEPPFQTTSAYEATPILVEGTLYLCTPFNRVLALDPTTGRERWAFDPEIDVHRNYPNQLVCRGVAAWRDPAHGSAGLEGPSGVAQRGDAAAEDERGEAAEDAADRADPAERADTAAEDAQGETTEARGTCALRILTATNGAKLHALDAHTGEPCAGFGEDGAVDLTRGVGELAYPGEYHVTSAPVVVGDVVVVGSAVADNVRRDAPAGVVRGYDARSGALRWAWDPAPGAAGLAPGEGVQGWTPGTPNVWAPMSADPERDLVFLPTGNASPDYFSAVRGELDTYASSVVALRASTGELAWHFQTVHHDVWDYDLAAQPTLTTLQRGDEEIPVVVQATKMGLVFVLHRETGEPFHPVEERSVPQGGVPGERLSPTQPFPVRPPPLVRHALAPEDAFGLTPWDRGRCRDTLEDLRYEGIYTPPSLEGTLMLPGNSGGVNWGGVAVDPGRRWMVVNVMDAPWKLRLFPTEDYEEERAAHPGKEVSPMRGAPYGLLRDMVLSPLGLPCAAPPWGKLFAVDLQAGEIRWEIPFGTVRDLAPFPLPLNWGVPSLGGPLVTASGLVFIGAAMDDYLRAYDLATGEELWKGRLPAGGQATPMTYRAEGRQYVVIAAGGHGRAGTTLGDALVAFALPD